MVWSTRLWRHILLGSKRTVVLTDHAALTSLTSKKDLQSSRLARYALDLSEFDLEFQFRPGKYHFLPDWLSRAELIQLDSEDRLKSEIERLDRLHEKNLACLLREDLARLLCTTENVAGEALLSDAAVGTKENNYKNSVIFAKNRAHQGWQTLVNKNAPKSPGFSDCRLNFASKISDSRAVQAEANTISVKQRLIELVDEPTRDCITPDDVPPSRAASMYESIYAVATDTLGRALLGDDSPINQTKQENTLSPTEAQLYQELARADEPLTRLVQEAQCTDLFAVAMRNFLTSGRKVLPRDELIRLDVLRLAPQYVLNENNWLLHLDPDDKHLTFNKPALYVPVGLRGEVLNRVHVEAGHTAAAKTYAIARRHFFWPGLYVDARRLQEHCLQCKMHTPKKAKAKMAGHLQATAAGQVWVLDLLHLSESEDGCHLVICMVDVFSRYAVVEKLSAATSQQVKMAFQDRIMTICAPHKVITDGGSEFKGEFTVAMRELGIEHHVTTACHSEGHGVVERFNKTIATKLSKLMVAQGKEKWTNHLGAAMIAYNCIPHTAHNLTPMQVFFSTVETSLLPSSLDVQEQLDAKHNSALEMVLSRKAMKLAVTKRLQTYNQQLEQSTKEARRATRTLKVGMTVLVFRDKGGKLTNKWGDRFDGPFVVTIDEGNNVYSVQRIGSDDKPQKEHVDNLVEAPVLPAAVQLSGLEQVGLLDAVKEISQVENQSSLALGAQNAQLAIQPETTRTKAQTKETTATRKKYEVKYIAGCEDDKFLIKWKGFDVATWEPISNLDCPKLIRDFSRLTSREKSRLKSRTLTSELQNASISSICSTQTTSVFMKRDLSKYTEGDMIAALCEELGLKSSDILLVWASPDCRTYSPADASNISRGNEYRDHNDPFRGPKQTIDGKRMEAIKQDNLVSSLLKSFLDASGKDKGINLIMENPMGSLRYRPFVWIYELLIGLERHTVDYCAFGSDRRKSTDFWCNFGWNPVGDTGDGRCHQRCKAGYWISLANKLSYRHPVVVGGGNDRRPLGAFAKSKIPERLHQDIVKAAIKRSQQDGSSGHRKTIVELFAGSTALGTVARQEGLDYVAVDWSSLSQNSFKKLHVSDEGVDQMKKYFDIDDNIIAAAC